MSVKRSFVHLENEVIRLLQMCPRTVWELSSALNSNEETIKKRLDRLGERGVVRQVNKLWFWLTPEQRIAVSHVEKKKALEVE